MATKKNLVIVESPAKARTLGRILGSKYVLKASMVHVRDLPKSKLGWCVKLVSAQICRSRGSETTVAISKINYQINISEVK